MMKHGTTTVEIKTGYGLTMDAEVKMLEAINELADEEMIADRPDVPRRPCLPAGIRGGPGTTMSS